MQHIQLKPVSWNIWKELIFVFAPLTEFLSAAATAEVEEEVEGGVDGDQ